MDKKLLWNVHVFMTASQTSSFRAAAKQLDHEPSAVTAAIKALESQLMAGRPLFVRRATGTQLTKDGLRLVPVAQALLDAADKFHQGTQAIQTVRPTIRIGTIQGAWHQILAEAENNLDTNIQLEPVAIDPYWPTQPLLTGDIDWALLPAASDNDPKLHRLPVFTEPRVVSTSTRSSIGHLDEATLAEIDAETWIGVPPGADKAFTSAHRCDDIRPGPAPKTGRYLLNPIDIGNALRNAEFVIGSMNSITSMFAGLIDGIRDVEIKDAPPWEISLVTLRSQRTSNQPTPEDLCKAIRDAVATLDSPGMRLA